MDGSDMFHFEEELKKLPAKPGVYIMHDKEDAIIYVGKAISLRNRVRSYFRESTNKSPKIEKMVTKIARFEYIVTDSELEALVLETDAPDIPPHWLYTTAELRAAGQPQGRNSSAELPRIAAEIARLRGMDIEQLAQACTANARKALKGLPALP